MMVFLAAAVFLMGGTLFLTLAATASRDTAGTHWGSIRAAREDMAGSPVWRGVVFLAGALTPLHTHPLARTYAASLETRLRLAGSPWGLRGEEFLTAKECLGAASAGLCAAMGAASPLPLAACLAGGFFLPDIWLRDRVAVRARDIVRALPLSLDLLTVFVEAGLDLFAALGRVVDRIPAGPLQDELRQTLQEVRLGLRRSDALRGFAARVGITEITMLVSTIVQAGDMGIGVGQGLRIYSADLRRKRFVDAEKRAMEAPVKMSFPLLFIFLSVFILLFGALGLSVLSQGIWS